MEYSTAVALTATGTLMLLPDEIVRKMQTNVDIYIGAIKSDAHRHGVATVTTHRIVWVNQAGKAGIQWPLAQIESVTGEAGGLFVGSPKIVLTIGPPGVVGPAADKSSDGFVMLPTAASGGVPKTIKLSFKDGNRDEFIAEVKTALSRKSWVVDAEPAAKKAGKEFSTQTAGIAGILSRLDETRESEAALAQKAFSGVTELVNNAKQIVKMADAYAARVQASKARSRDAAAAGAGDAAMATPGQTAEEVDAFSSVLRHIGLTSPVTRAVAGELYNQELARQLAEFLRPQLERSAGMMTLTDAYCLYNRARGTDLISPDDLLEACGLFGTLRLGMHIRNLSSGVKLVQLDSYREDAVIRRVVSLLGPGREFLTAMDVAKLCQVPLPAAQQYLEAAEASTALCRDDTIRGLRFYPNRFL